MPVRCYNPRMTFTATIVRTSNIWRTWRSMGRSVGDVAGVAFRWTGGDYVSGALTADQVGTFRNHTQIRLEVAAVMPMPMAAVEPVDPMKVFEDSLLPPGNVEFRDRDGAVVGQIVNVGTTPMPTLPPPPAPPAQQVNSHRFAKGNQMNRFGKGKASG